MDLGAVEGEKARRIRKEEGTFIEGRMGGRVELVVLVRGLERLYRVMERLLDFHRPRWVRVAVFLAHLVCNSKCGMDRINSNSLPNIINNNNPIPQTCLTHNTLNHSLS